MTEHIHVLVSWPQAARAHISTYKRIFLKVVYGVSHNQTVDLCCSFAGHLIIVSKWNNNLTLSEMRPEL